MKRNFEFTANAVAVSFAPTEVQMSVARAHALAGELQAADSRPPMPGHYIVETRGKAAQQVVDEVNALADQHAQLSVRIYEGEALLTAPLAVGGQSYTWTDCTVRRRGPDWELYASLRGPDGKSHRFSIVRGLVSELPNNAELMQIVNTELLAKHQADAAHAATLTELQALLS